MDPDIAPPRPASAEPPELPGKVERAAASRDLGAYETGTATDHPVTSALQVLLVAAILLGAGWGLDLLADAVDIRLLGWVSTLVVIIALVVVGFAVYALLDGARALYVFAGGVVWTRNRRVESATWAEVDRLVTANAFPPLQSGGAALVAIDGREAFVELGEGTDEFRDRLVAAVKAADRPVGPDVPTTRGLALEENRGQAALRSVIASLVLTAVLYGLLALYDVAGLPFGAALFLTFAASSLAAVLLRPARVIAVVVAALAGLFLVLDTNRWSDSGILLVTAVVIALEIGTVSGWRKLARRLPAPRRLGPRRRLASKRGWQYRDTAELPVPGPRSTYELIGVPTAAATTTGEGVLTATANGFECTVYDRVRRRPLVGDPIRTVWQVTLPVSVPDYHRNFGPASETPLGGYLVMPSPAAQIVQDAQGTGTHPFWWVEGRYLCSREDRYASPRVIAARMDYLTLLAARVPWERIADPAMWLPEQPAGSLPPWNPSLFSTPVTDAFRLAVREVPPGAELTTGRVLAALARIDLTLDWHRLWLRTGSPEAVGLATALDRRTAGEPSSWGGATVSPELSRALSAAQRIRNQYQYPVISTGAAALGLVAFRGAGAAEALLSGGRLSHAELIDEVHADIVGSTLENLDAILPALKDSGLQG